MRFRFPWQRRMDEAKTETERAANAYEWAVQNRTTVQLVVGRILHHGAENGLIEKLNIVARGGHK